MRASNDGHLFSVEVHNVPLTETQITLTVAWLWRPLLTVELWEILAKDEDEIMRKIPALHSPRKLNASRNTAKRHFRLSIQGTARWNSR
jgi:hypothetical protein